MGIGGQREGAEASLEKQYAHTNVIDTLEVTCTTGFEPGSHRLSAYPPNHKTIRSRLSPARCSGSPCTGEDADFLVHLKSLCYIHVHMWLLCLDVCCALCLYSGNGPGRGCVWSEGNYGHAPRQEKKAE